MKKLLLFACMICAGFLQAQISDDFEGAIKTGWIGNGNYMLSQSDGILNVSVNKGMPDQFFTYDLGATTDLTANAVLNLKLRGNRPFILQATLIASNGTKLSKEVKVAASVSIFNNYSFDFTAFAAKNLATKIEFAVNAPENSFEGKVYFDDLLLGTGALKLANISPVLNEVAFKNTDENKIILTGISNAETISVTGGAAIMANASVSAITSGNAILSYDATAAGTATITITLNAATGYTNNTTTYTLTVEDDSIPTLDDPADISVPMGKETIVKLSGIGDGNASTDQIVKVSVASSNTAAIPVPSVSYDTMGSPYAYLKVNPATAGTSTITVTVKDNGATNNTISKTFDITAYDGYNNSPTMKTPVKQSIFNKAPFTLKLLLSGISDGDNGTQTLTITATSKHGFVTPSSPVSYVTGKDTASLLLTANSLGKDTVTITVVDNGNTGTNNGNQTVVLSFPVEVLAPAPTGYVVTMNDFTADTTAKLWTIEKQGQTQFASYVDTLGQKCLRIIMKQKMDFTGLWFNLYKLPLEIDVTNAPYMSYEIYSKDVAPLPTLAYFWNSDSIRNTSGPKLETKTITTPDTGFTKVFMDFRLPGYLNDKDGIPMNTSRITMLLLNYHKNELDWPNTFIDGTIYIRNIRIGDACIDVPTITPVCTVDPMPTEVVWVGSGAKTLKLTGISNGSGNTTDVTLSVLSSKPAFMANPIVGTLNADGTVDITYTAGSTIDSAQIIVRVNKTDALQKEMRFWIKTVSDDISKAVVITVDATTKGQTIAGYGAMEPPELLMDDYAKDLGCQMMRVTYDEGFEMANDNSNAKVMNRSAYNKNKLNIDYIRNAYAAGVTEFFVTLWSPPGWMKENCSFVGGAYGSAGWETQKNKVNPIYYDEYVEYMVSIVRMVKEETGVEIAGFCPQNEPAFVEPYGSGVMDPVHMAQVCGMLGKRLEEEGFKTKVVTSEQVFTQGSWSVSDYANAIKNDSLAKKYSDVVAMHYPNDELVRWGVQWNACKAANQEYWATECRSEGNNFPAIIDQCKYMINGLNNGCSAWIIWGYNQGASGNELDASKKEGLTFGFGKGIHYHAYKNFAKFIKKGDVQLKTKSSNAVIRAASVFNENDSILTIVLVNTDSKIPYSVKMAGSAPAMGYEAYRTTFYERCEKVDPFKNGLINLPPYSVTTLVLKNNVNNAPYIDQVSDKDLEVNASETLIGLSTISCGDIIPQDITITAVSSNPSLIPNPTVTYVSPLTTGTLSVTPVADQLGTATITVIVKDNGGTANGGVDSVKMEFKINVKVSDLTDLSEMIAIYPNPAKDVVTVNVPAGIINTIRVVDLSGKTVLSQSVLTDQTSLILNVSQLAVGTYVIYLDGENQMYSEKLIKQ